MKISEIVERNWAEVEEEMHHEVVNYPWCECMLWTVYDMSGRAKKILEERALERAYELEYEDSKRIGYQAKGVLWHYYYCQLEELAGNWLKAQQQFQDERWWA